MMHSYLFFIVSLIHALFKYYYVQIVYCLNKFKDSYQVLGKKLGFDFPLVKNCSKIHQECTNILYSLDLYTTYGLGINVYKVECDKKHMPYCNV